MESITLEVGKIFVSRIGRVVTIEEKLPPVTTTMNHVDNLFRGDNGRVYSDTGRYILTNDQNLRDRDDLTLEIPQDDLDSVRQLNAKQSHGLLADQSKYRRQGLTEGGYYVASDGTVIRLQTPIPIRSGDASVNIYPATNGRLFLPDGKALVFEGQSLVSLLGAFHYDKPVDPGLRIESGKRYRTKGKGVVVIDKGYLERYVENGTQTIYAGISEDSHKFRIEYLPDGRLFLEHISAKDEWTIVSEEIPLTFEVNETYVTEDDNLVTLTGKTFGERPRIEAKAFGLEGSYIVYDTKGKVVPEMSGGRTEGDIVRKATFNDLAKKVLVSSVVPPQDLPSDLSHHILQVKNICSAQGLVAAVSIT